MAYSQKWKLNLIKFQNQHKNFKTLSFAHKCKREKSLEIPYSLFVHIINDCNILVYNALKKNTPYRNQNII